MIPAELRDHGNQSSISGIVNRAAGTGCDVALKNGGIGNCQCARGIVDRTAVLSLIGGEISGNRQCTRGIVDRTAVSGCRVAAEHSIGNRQCTRGIVDCAAVFSRLIPRKFERSGDCQRTGVVESAAVLGLIGGKDCIPRKSQ